MVQRTFHVELGAGTELGGAYGREVGRVRAQEPPGRVQVVVQLDLTLLVRCGTINPHPHHTTPPQCARSNAPDSRKVIIVALVSINLPSI